LSPAFSPGDADVVVVNTCAFVEEARQESIDTILALADGRKSGSEIVVTGCLAERYGQELAEALPEVDRVGGFGVPLTNGAGGGGPTSVAVSIGTKPSVAQNMVPEFDLLNLPRPRSSAPWAYVKIAEGCDRACGFCAIPSFRGPQRSRSRTSILDEVEALEVKEVVLVAQDLASYGRDQGHGNKELIPLVSEVGALVDRVRLLYLYPSELTDRLIDTICETQVPYFDLSLQHVSRPLLRKMRRWGDGSLFLERIEAIRRREPNAVFRSNFIVGYPGETEADHDALLEFVAAARLDWCGLFSYSAEAGTYAVGLDGAVAAELVAERLDELNLIQDTITQAQRDDLIGEQVEVLVDAVGVGRTHREAPEIDGVVRLPPNLAPGTFHSVEVVAVQGPDLLTDGAVTESDDD